MDSYLTFLTATRSPTSSSYPSNSPVSPSDVCTYKLSARHRHRKRPTATSSTPSNKDPPLRPQHRPDVHGAFRSAVVLNEVMRLETDASRTKLQPEDAFALLRRILSPRDLISGAVGEDEELSLSELLDGIDAACWRTLTTSAVNGSASPRDLVPWSPSHASSHCEAEACTHDANPVKVRFSQLYSGIQASIFEKQRLLSSLQAKFQHAIERNDELPGVIREREAAILRIKDTFVAGAVKTLSCDDGPPSQRDAGLGFVALTAAARAVEEKVQTLRRRRDLRAWACTELRSTINDHMTRASELKKEISALVADVKKEEMVHKLKAKRVEAIMTATSHRSTVNASASILVDPSAPHRSSPEDVVALAHAKKQQLLNAIEQRKTQLRARTEQVFNARNEVVMLEHKRADVAERVTVLEQEIAHIQRACTPRPEWTQLLNAALVTTAIDRAGKKAKLRMESSRKKLKGGKHESDTDEQEESGERRLKQILTSSWSTIDKVYAMSTELTRIRTKYHAGDLIIVEQAKLDHLQKEIAKALQQLEVIKAKSVE